MGKGAGWQAPARGRLPAGPALTRCCTRPSAPAFRRLPHVPIRPARRAAGGLQSRRRRVALPCSTPRRSLRLEVLAALATAQRRRLAGELVDGRRLYGPLAVTVPWRRSLVSVSFTVECGRPVCAVTSHVASGPCRSVARIIGRAVPLAWRACPTDASGAACWQDQQRASSGERYRLSWHPHRSQVPAVAGSTGGDVSSGHERITADAVPAPSP